VGRNVDEVLRVLDRCSLELCACNWRKATDTEAGELLKASA